MTNPKRSDFVAIVIVAAVVVVAAGGFLLHQHGAAGWPFAGGPRQLYTCSMHPYYTSDRPGECPICGMTLVPVKKTPAATTKGEYESHVAGMAAVEIDPRQQQLIGVTFATVERKDITRTVRAVGVVVPDERRVYTVSTKVDGWIERLYVNATGQPVAVGQPLLAIYSPEVYATQEEYRVAAENARALAGSQAEGVSAGAEALRDAAARRLAYWDITPGDIESVEAGSGPPEKTLTVRSPVGGYVLDKMATVGMRAEPGMPLYTVADLSRVWVEADVYEYELPYVEVGQEVEITLPYYPAEPITGTVKFIYPVLDPMTRTAKVRVEVPNPGLKLKPAMFANVALKQDLGEQLVVPESAVLDSGNEKIVFVVHGEGHFEPRVITVATKADDYYVVASGLKEGERVAASGNFLIDSESRIKGAAAAIGGGGMAGMPGMGAAPKKAGAGKTGTPGMSGMPGMPGMSGD